MKNFVFLALLASTLSTGASLAVPPSPSAVLKGTAATQESYRRWLCEDEAACIQDMRNARLPEIRQKSIRRLVLELAGLSKPATSGPRGLLQDLLREDKTLSEALESFLNDQRSRLSVGARAKYLAKRLAHAVFGASPPSMQEIIDTADAVDFLRSFRGHLVEHMKTHNIPTRTTVSDRQYAPFEFLPQFLGSIQSLGEGTFKVTSSDCFDEIVINNMYNMSDRTSVLSLSASLAKSLTCSEQLVAFGGPGVLSFNVVDWLHRDKQVKLNLSSLFESEANQWYARRYGLQLFNIPTKSLIESVVSLIDTVVLMSGFDEKPLSPATYAVNVDFMQRYVQFDEGRMGPKVQARTVGPVVARELNPDFVKSGDLMIMLRADGVDPMISWGEGSVGGHTVLAMRDSQNRLLVCESTTKDAYWPDNGIQCHEWRQWLELCEDAEQNIVIVPLDEKTRAKFNSSAAMKFFEDYKDVDYGYQTFLFGWIDTLSGNFPCTPGSNFTVCLVPEATLQVAILFDSIFSDNHLNFFRQALAHRAGTWKAESTPSVLETLSAASKQGKSFSDLYQMVELDSYMYYTKRNDQPVISKAMVCCVFVCNMWKAGGIFDELGDNFQCGEQTLWDLYSMAIFDSGRMGDSRPEVCRKADPTNKLCQLTGNLTLYLQPDLNTRPLYRNMGERCAAVPPKYIRPSGC